MSRLRHERRATRGAAAVLSCLLAAAIAFGVGGCVRGTSIELDSLHPLDPSPASEQVLRTLRLAGVTDASVGLDGRAAVAVVRLPAADSAAQVEAGSLTSVAALRSAFPQAGEYRVGLLGPDGGPIAEVSWANGAQVRSADAATLRRSGPVRYPASAEDMTVAGGAALFAMGSLPPDYLDAKNRATDIDGSSAKAPYELMEKSVPGRPAPSASQDAGVVTAMRIATLLRGATEPSAAALREVALGTQPGASPEQVLALRYRLSAVEALSGAAIPGEEKLLSEVTKLAKQVAESPVPKSGPQADALLVAAGSDDAPAEAREVALFEPVPSRDATGSPDGSALPNRVLAALGAQGAPDATVPWEGGNVAPESWLGYQRADGKLYWLAGAGGPAALTDMTLEGFAWTTPRAALVESANVGRELVSLPLP